MAPPPPASLWAALAARRDLLREFLKFGVVGGVGFLCDAGTVYALRGALGLYGAGMASYVVAASVTWALNRCWTFRGRSNGAMHRQWVLFLATNLLGFVLNRGAYAALITFSPLCRAWPVLAVAAGGIAGMFVNFGLARGVVFRQTDRPGPHVTRQIP
jgi:putative flippase GtrA